MLAQSTNQEMLDVIKKVFVLIYVPADSGSRRRWRNDKSSHRGRRV